MWVQPSRNQTTQERWWVYDGSFKIKNGSNILATIFSTLPVISVSKRCLQYPGGPPNHLEQSIFLIFEPKDVFKIRWTGKLPNSRIKICLQNPITDALYVSLVAVAPLWTELISIDQKIPMCGVGMLFIGLFIKDDWWESCMQKQCGNWILPRYRILHFSLIWNHSYVSTAFLAAELRVWIATSRHQLRWCRQSEFRFYQLAELFASHSLCKSIWTEKSGNWSLPILCPFIVVSFIYVANSN